MNEKWDMRFLQMASLTSSFSKDPSTRVGAVCVDHRNRVLGIGFNGFSRNTEDDERLYDRPKKYQIIIHAEHNCLMNCSSSTVGATMYITHPPCKHCCAILDTYEISRVVFAEPTGDFGSRWNIPEIIEYLQELGIQYDIYRENP